MRGRLRGTVEAMSDSGNTARGPVVRAIPEGDDRERMVCPDCGFIDYDNPKVVVGSVVLWDDRILLCRRAIPPRRGFWTLPAGYLETNETAAEGAAREAREEACAEIEIETVLAVYSIPRISQVQVIYRARLVSPDIAAGRESQEVGLFGWDEIPWDDLAFPSVHWALRHYDEVRGETIFAARFNPPGETGEY
jgi:ADP-ribose pyrophosphatase YjhB (NUDIX family)